MSLNLQILIESEVNSTNPNLEKLKNSVVKNISEILGLGEINFSELTSILNHIGFKIEEDLEIKESENGYIFNLNINGKEKIYMFILLNKFRENLFNKLDKEFNLKDIRNIVNRYNSIVSKYDRKYRINFEESNGNSLNEMIDNVEYFKKNNSDRISESDNKTLETIITEGKGKLNQKKRFEKIKLDLRNSIESDETCEEFDNAFEKAVEETNKLNLSQTYEVKKEEIIIEKNGENKPKQVEPEQPSGINQTRKEEKQPKIPGIKLINPKDFLNKMPKKLYMTIIGALLSLGIGTQYYINKGQNYIPNIYANSKNNGGDISGKNILTGQMKEQEKIVLQEIYDKSLLAAQNIEEFREKFRNNFFSSILEKKYGLNINWDKKSGEIIIDLINLNNGDIHNFPKSLEAEKNDKFKLDYILKEFNKMLSIYFYQESEIDAKNIDFFSNNIFELFKKIVGFDFGGNKLEEETFSLKTILDIEENDKKIQDFINIETSKLVDNSIKLQEKIIGEKIVKDGTLDNLAKKLDTILRENSLLKNTQGMKIHFFDIGTALVFFLEIKSDGSDNRFYSSIFLKNDNNGIKPLNYCIIGN